MSRRRTILRPIGVLMVIVPVTAVLAAGATLLALYYCGLLSPPPETTPVLAPVLDAPEMTPAIRVGVPASVSVPAPEVPSKPDAVADSTIDYLRLNADMRRVSDALERFNQKLLDVIDAERQRRQAREETP